MNERQRPQVITRDKIHNLRTLDVDHAAIPPNPTRTVYIKDESQPHYTKEESELIAYFSNMQQKFIQHAYRMLGNFQDAEQTVQEAFTRLWATREKYKIPPGESRNPLAYTFLHNAVRDVHRKKRTEIDIEETILTTEDSSEVALQNEQRRELQQALTQIPTKYAVVMQLFYFRDMSTVQIAQKLGIPVATVITRLHRGRNALRTVLEEETSPAESLNK